LIRDLVNQKLNINTTSAKGIEKAIGVIATFVINAQSATNGIIYGKYELNENEGNLISRAFDKGIVYILEKISTVDFCNLVNYLSNRNEFKVQKKICFASNSYWFFVCWS
jgi:hypothetical protein